MIFYSKLYIDGIPHNFASQIEILLEFGDFFFSSERQFIKVHLSDNARSSFKEFSQSQNSVSKSRSKSNIDGKIIISG
jgi:hypothetical protein